MGQLDLASGTDLDRWADLIEARSRLPQLVRRLISATGKGVAAVTFRAGEGVQYPGWDGVVRATGSDVHVPEGTSVWEIGASKEITTKANKDYEKRTDDPGDVAPPDTTFVFVTPRRWPGKEEWIKKRNAKGKWKEVQAYDADDLEHWLERAPGVHAWISSLIGKDPFEVESLETWWESWSRSTVPPLLPKALLSGRQAEAERVQQVVQMDADALSFSGDSQQETVAFFVSVLLEFAPQVLPRAVVVKTPKAWRQISASEDPLLLIPLFEDADVALAIRNGHHVLIPLGREAAMNADLELPRLRREGIEQALIDEGVPKDRASRLATLGRRSLLAMRRKLAMSSGLSVPEWSSPERASEILSALLAGRWRDSSKGDREALSQLAGRSYEDLAKDLFRWSHSSDPPVRRVGDIWLIASKLDAWILVAKHLTDDDLRRFKEVTFEVLTSDDPSLDLDPKEKLTAPLLGKTRRYSHHLTQGIADTLAVMGAVSDRVTLSGGRKSQDIADAIVAELLKWANGDRSGRGWILLSSVLPTLAEAAPDVFMSAVEIGLADEQPILAVFQDKADEFDVFLNSSSAHTGLLWALENLAWHPDYVSRAALVLAKLARLDPGGRLSNRPEKSLREIFVIWHPGTAAKLDRRLQAIDLIRKREPDVAWNLLVRLLPSDYDVATPPHSPSRRDWKPEEDQDVPPDERRDAFVGVADRLMQDVDDDIGRWTEVLERYSGFPPKDRERIVAAVEEFDASKLSSEERQTIVDALRELITRHRLHPDAYWALSDEDLERVEETLARLAPLDSWRRHHWLFETGAIRAFPDEDDRRQRFEKHLSSQIDAVQETYDSEGVDGVVAWSEEFDSDHDHGIFALGRALGRAQISDGDAEKVLDMLDSASKRERTLVSGFITGRLVANGEDWTQWTARVIAKHKGWTPAQVAEFLGNLPHNPEVWDMAEQAGPSVDKEYWLRVSTHGLTNRDESCVRAAEKLVDYGRPHAAVSLLGLYADDIPGGPPDELVALALEKAVTTKPVGPVDQSFKYHVGQHLDRLTARSFDEDRLALLEWAYVPLFRYEKRKSTVLHGALSSDPALFAEVVSMVYPREDEDADDEVTEDDVARAEMAHDLLDSWQEVPGTHEDGSVDGDELLKWVQDARSHLEDKGRQSVGDRRIGRLLRYGPAADGDDWPCEEIRDVIEEIASQDLEHGFELEVYNSRGTTVRAPNQGGGQERNLVTRYRDYAANAAGGWPRTAAILKRIAHSYEQDARRYDVDADLTEDLWR